MEVQKCDKEKEENEKFLYTDEKQEKTKGVHQQPQRWKLKLFALYCIYIGLGVGSSLNGPTMVDMEEWLGTDTSGISIALAVGNVGYMFGSALCSVVYKRIRLEFQLLLDAILFGSCIAIAPWPRNLVVYSVFIMLRGVPMGLIVSSGQGYLLSLMEGNRFRNPAIQLLHSVWSIGASTAPLIVKPFLRPDMQTKQFTFNTSNMINATNVVPFASNITSPWYFSNKTSNELEGTFPLLVPYAFLTTGLVTMALGIPMLIAFVLGPLSIRIYKKKQEKDEQQCSPMKQPKKFRVILLIFLFIWFHCYPYVEELAGSYLAPFVIKYLGWSRLTGPLISSTLWGSHGIGRLLAVPVSLYATPRQMIISSMTLTATGFALMLVLMNVYPTVVWISVSLAGLGMSSAFGTMTLWASKHIPICGTSSAVFILGCSSASMTAPLIAGFLFEKVSPVWAVYLMLIAAVMQIVTYIAMVIYVHCPKIFNSSLPASSVYEQDQLANEKATYV